MGIGDKFVKQISAEAEVRPLSLSHPSFQDEQGKRLTLLAEPELVEADNRTAIAYGEWEGKTFHYLFKDEFGQVWSLFSPSFRLLRALNAEVSINKPFRLRITYENNERSYFIGQCD